MCEFYGCVMGIWLCLSKKIVYGNICDSKNVKFDSWGDIHFYVFFNTFIFKFSPYIYSSKIYIL